MRLPLLFLALAAALPATENGMPLAHTGAFGEPTCDKAGCHRAAPLETSAHARIEVGPYVPGATQEVNVTIDSPSATRWGYQLTARRANNPAVPAGTFEAVNQFSRVRCADGTELPCGDNELQYATHTSAAPVGRGGRFSFFVNWTAPDQDVGPVIFNASALAADGDMGTNNDGTTTTQTRSLFAPSNNPEISMDGVVGAASLAFGGQAISPLQLVSLFGLRFATEGTAINVAREDFDVQGRIPDELNRISVELTVPGENPILGRVVFVQPNQINLQAPDFEIGPAETVSVQAVFNLDRGDNEVRGNVVESATAPAAPGLFTFSSTGQGYVAAVAADGRPISPIDPSANSRPAVPGERILVFGTGFGATETPLRPGELNSGLNPLVEPITVTIGTTQLMESEVEYAGAAPSFAGLTQLNLVLPEGLSDGEHEIRARVGSDGEYATQPGVTLVVDGMQ